MNKRREYATWRWNHTDSSRGSHRILGLMHFRIFLHMGSNIKAASTDKARADPLDIQTEYCSVFSAASLESAAWMYLRGSIISRCQDIDIGNTPSTGEQSNMHAPENTIEQYLRRGKISPPESLHGDNSCRLNRTMQKGVSYNSSRRDHRPAMTSINRLSRDSLCLS